jgi:hypothetical protein
MPIGLGIVLRLTLLCLRLIKSRQQVCVICAISLVFLIMTTRFRFGLTGGSAENFPDECFILR